jgi:hypothetical protein
MDNSINFLNKIFFFTIYMKKTAHFISGTELSLILYKILIT